MNQQTSLYTLHQQAGAKLVDFAGWDMPLHYGSQLEEHHAVRRDAGVFDVSHMAAVDVVGEQAADFLRYMVANNIDKLQQPGKALYTCMLNPQGGVIDDLIIYYLAQDYYRLVVNAGTREKDIAWLNQHAVNFKVTAKERRDLAILAIQGPQAREKALPLFLSEQREAIAALKPFHCAYWANWLVARTGYTGEDGFEVILPLDETPRFWKALLAQNIKPCGLGARDTLRLEAGLNLYGSDMDETITPYEANLAWTVAMEPATRDFIGRSALETQLKKGVTRQLVGLVLTERGVLRGHQKVIVEGIGEGEITSGSFSPTLNCSIALARIPAVPLDNPCQVVIRDKLFPVKMIKPPFVKKGQKAF